jgi:hypothetical protein
MKFPEDVQQVIREAQVRLFLHVPKERILALYLKGSQVHGMTNADSDVDFVAILKQEEDLAAVYEVSKQDGTTTKPPFSISAYVLSELQTGKLIPGRPPIPGVSRFVKHLDGLELIFGERPEEPLFRRTDQKDLEVNVRNFFNIYIPGYESGAYQFKDMVKQVLWLAEAEARVLGATVTHSWQDAVAALPSTHIAHVAFKYRLEGNPDIATQERFISNLKSHLEKLRGETT